MNTFEKLSTMSVAIIGAISGTWGAYTAHDATKFKQPFDEHEKVASSFQSQISSAEKRKDKIEALRVRILYEKFEEGWREGRAIAGLVAPVEALVSSKLGDKELAELNKLFSSSSNKSDFGLPAKTLGAAYLAVGEYENAIRHLKIASARKDDPRALALQSVAFGRLAKGASTTGVKVNYEELAIESFRAALDSPTAKPNELTGYASANADLRGILFDSGVLPANEILTRP